MPYCSQAQIENRLSALPAQIAQAPESFDSIITEAILWAQSEIDLDLSEKYPVPWADADVPPGVSQIAADLATAFVLRATFSGGGEDSQPKLAIVWEDSARANLKKLRERENAIPGATPAQAQIAESVAFHSRPHQHSIIERMDFQRAHGHCPRGMGPYGGG